LAFGNGGRMTGVRTSASVVAYTEYELLQHQKEELEMQNRRLVERISKLKYILQGACYRQK